MSLKDWQLPIVLQAMSKAPQKLTQGLATQAQHAGPTLRRATSAEAGPLSGAAVPAAAMLQFIIGVIPVQHSALSACCRPVSPVRRREPRRDTPPRRSRRSPSPQRGRRRGDSPRRRASPPRKRTRTPPAKVLLPPQSRVYAAGCFTRLTSCVMGYLGLLLCYFHKYERDMHAVLRQVQLSQQIWLSGSALTPPGAAMAC